MGAPNSPYDIKRPLEFLSVPEATDCEAARTDLREKFERCSFCNSKLLFSHDLNLSYFEVVESSRCPGCGVTMRPKKFTLH